MKPKIESLKSIFSEPERYLDRDVTVSGWVRTIRDQKKFGFITLNDGSSFRSLQIVIEPDQLSNYDEISHTGNGAALLATGRIVLTPEARQPLEMKAVSVTVAGTSPPNYPLQPKRHSPEFLRTIAHLRPRTNLYAAVFRVRSKMAYAIHRFFNARDFVYVHTPIITGSDAEGAGEMFQVTSFDLDQPPRKEDGTLNYGADFFGKKAHLTVSGQLNAEAFALAFRNVYTFGPTFRAEHSNTARHAAEFWMIEPEMAFADLSDNMALAKDLIQTLIRDLLAECPEEMAFFNQFLDKGLIERLTKVAESDFGVMTYTDAVSELEKVADRFEYPVFWGMDLQTEHERYLTEQLHQRPVFVTDYPKDIKAFYMKQNPDGKTVAAMDCLVPGIGEIVGGSQREDDVDVLLQRIKDFGLKPEEYDWYLDLRRYGSVQHAGFGLGFERMLMYVTGVGNIRDVLPFPRTTGSALF